MLEVDCKDPTNAMPSRIPTWPHAARRDRLHDLGERPVNSEETAAAGRTPGVQKLLTFGDGEVLASKRLRQRGPLNAARRPAPLSVVAPSVLLRRETQIRLAPPRSRQGRLATGEGKVLT